MPTGYTAAIADGQSFEDFALSCARAFGACMHQRDSGGDERPKKIDVDNSYHVSRLAEAKAELARLNAMLPEEREAIGEKSRQEAIDQAQTYFNEKLVLRAQYDEMIAKVQAWTPPSPDHINLQKFMVDQIVDSIKWDCDTNYAMKDLTEATAKTPANYYNKLVGAAEWEVKYHSEQIEKEKTRADGANLWIEQLYTSLGVAY